MDGAESGTIVDLTASFQLSEKFKLGLNAADWSGNGDKVGYTGVALYPSVAVNDSFGLGLRAEYFKSKENSAMIGLGADNSVTAFTFSANYKVGGLTIIPELRLDSAKADTFYDSDMMMTKSATQATIALVYGF